MKKICQIIALLFLNAILTTVFAQEAEIEKLIEIETEISEGHPLFEMLAELEANPLDINKASAGQLAQLPWISDVLAREIIRFRRQYGKFNAVDELLLLPSFEPDLLPLLKKYLTASSAPWLRSSALELKLRASRKLQTGKGYKTEYYHPSPTKIYNRLNWVLNERIRLGLLTEKDAGEKELTDFFAWYIEYDHQNSGSSVIIGHYLLEFGQGLILWNPYPQFKGSNPVYTAKSRARGATGYRMLDENFSLYGLSTQICANFYQVNLFYSTKRIDASIDPGSGQITHFYRTGYHRSQSEREKKDQLQEKIIGARIALLSQNKFSFAATGYLCDYDREISTKQDDRYRFDFNGKSNSVVGVDFNYSVGELNLFGEMGRSKNNGVGYIFGLIYDSKQLDFSTLYRNYDKHFHSLRGMSFSENSGPPQNEQGVFLGIRFKPTPRFRFSIYLDQFKFPWRSYSLPLPVSGKELLCSMEVKPAKKIWLYAHIKASQKAKSLMAIDERGNLAQLVLPGDQINVRLQLDLSPLSSIKVRQRLEKKWVIHRKINNLNYINPGRYSGTLLYQELTWQSKQKGALSFRITFFDTDDYQSRIYQFERDVPGVFSNQMLYGKGSKWYLLWRISMSRIFKFYLKYSSLHYYYRQSIGSGYDQIDGDRVDTINLQLEARL
ncbi:MAG: helix-hairpin-helix domain-containing protein [bacterium]|nr:helix-hairpin-helix domain-containing protein [bacterium]